MSVETEVGLLEDHKEDLAEIKKTLKDQLHIMQVKIDDINDIIIAKLRSESEGK